MTGETRKVDLPVGAFGMTAFSRSQKTVTFGMSVDDAEARLIMDAFNSGLGCKEDAA